MKNIKWKKDLNEFICSNNLYAIYCTYEYLLICVCYLRYDTSSPFLLSLSLSLFLSLSLSLSLSQCYVKFPEGHVSCVSSDVMPGFPVYIVFLLSVCQHTELKLHVYGLIEKTSMHYETSGTIYLQQIRNFSQANEVRKRK